MGTNTFSRSLGTIPGLEGLRARELRVLARLFDVVTVTGRFVPDPARELVMLRTGTVVDDEGGTHGPGTVLWAPGTPRGRVELLVLDRRARRDALEAVPSLASRLDGAPGLSGAASESAPDLVPAAPAALTTPAAGLD